MKPLTIEDVPEAWRTEAVASALTSVRWLAISEPIVPDRSLLLRPYTYCTPEETKCVILGDSPYHTAGKANGLAHGLSTGFTVSKRETLYGVECELRATLGVELVDTSLESWARQGVILTNINFTTVAGWNGVHTKVGWDGVTAALLAQVLREAPGATWLVWGIAPLRFLQSCVMGGYPRRAIITSHPSMVTAGLPLGTYSKFAGSGCFRFVRGDMVWGDPVNPVSEGKTK